MGLFPALQYEVFSEGSLIGDSSVTFTSVYTAFIASTLVFDIVHGYCYSATRNFLHDGKSSYFNCIMNPENTPL